MKKAITILILFFIAGNLYSQSGWIAINKPNNYGHPFFINANIGWIQKGGNNNNDSLLKTTDGGYNWFYLDNFFILESFSFINENTGYLASRKITLTWSLFFKTTDGGFNWDTVSVISGHLGILKIKFFDANTGLCYASNGGLCRTTNGGINWVSIPNGGQYLVFPSISTGYSSPLSTGVLAKTINNGINWTQIKTFSGNIASISFVNNLKGWILHSDTLKKTDDGGYIWTSYTNTPNNKYTTLFINENKGWICGKSGMIFNTTNGGVNWNLQISNTLSDLYYIQFINENTGFISGTGVLLRTTTGGTIGIKKLLSEVPSSFSLKQNYPNPFNPITKIRFDIAKIEDVRIVTYDISGKELDVLVNERIQPGTYEAEWNGEKFASGIYFYRMQAGDYIETRKMILLK